MNLTARWARGAQRNPQGRRRRDRRLRRHSRRRISDGGTRSVEEISKRGGTPLAWPSGSEVLGVVELKDIVKGGMKERFADLRRMGIKTVMITGDNALTAAAIAAEAGVDDFLAQATPEDKAETDPRISSRRAACGDDRRRDE